MDSYVKERVNLLKHMFQVYNAAVHQEAIISIYEKSKPYLSSRLSKTFQSCVYYKA